MLGMAIPIELLHPCFRTFTYWSFLNPSESQLHAQLQISAKSLQTSEYNGCTEIHRPNGILSLSQIFFHEALP